MEHILRFFPELTIKITQNSFVDIKNNFAHFGFLKIKIKTLISNFSCGDCYSISCMYKEGFCTLKKYIIFKYTWLRDGPGFVGSHLCRIPALLGLSLIFNIKNTQKTHFYEDKKNSKVSKAPLRKITVNSKLKWNRISVFLFVRIFPFSLWCKSFVLVS